VPDVVDVVRDAELFFDHVADARAGPQRSGEPVSFGAFEETAFQLFLSGGGQFWGAAGVGFGFKALEAILAERSVPKADGPAIDPQLAGDVNGAGTVLEKLDGLVAAFLELVGLSGWAHGVTSGKEYRILFIQESIAPSQSPGSVEGKTFFGRLKQGVASSQTSLLATTRV